jgi:hypothetical protein
MRYAIIEHGKVTNITLWDGVTPWTPAAGEAVACPENVGIGWTYDGQTWTAPEPVPEPPRIEWTYFDFFRDLHTVDEQDRYLDLEDELAIATQAGALTPELKAFRRFRALAQSAPVLRLDSPDMIAGISLLKSLGIYGAEPGASEREAQVLSGTLPAV